MEQFTSVGSYEKIIDNLTGEVTEYNFLLGGAIFKTDEQNKQGQMPPARRRCATKSKSGN